MQGKYFIEYIHFSLVRLSCCPPNHRPPSCNHRQLSTPGLERAPPSLKATPGSSWYRRAPSAAQEDLLASGTTFRGFNFASRRPGTPPPGAAPIGRSPPCLQASARASRAVSWPHPLPAPSTHLECLFYCSWALATTRLYQQRHKPPPPTPGRTANPQGIAPPCPLAPPAPPDFRLSPGIVLS